MIWIWTFPADPCTLYRVSFAERVAIQTIQLTYDYSTGDYQHQYLGHNWCAGLPEILGIPKNIGFTQYFGLPDTQWFSKLNQVGYWKKVSGSGRVFCTRWALLMTTGRMNSSEVDLLWVCEEHHGCSLSSSSLTSKANVVRSQEDSHLFNVVYVVFDWIRWVWWSFSDYMIFWFVSVIAMWAVGPAKKCQVNNNILYWGQV